MDDLIPILTRFHREILLPDMERIADASEQRVRDDIHSVLDAQAQDLTTLRTEYQMIVTALKRMEQWLEPVDERLERLEKKVDKLALRSELVDLKARIDLLQVQIRTIEARLED